MTKVSINLHTDFDFNVKAAKLVFDKERHFVKEVFHNTRKSVTFILTHQTCLVKNSQLYRIEEQHMSLYYEQKEVVHKLKVDAEVKHTQNYISVEVDLHLLKHYDFDHFGSTIRQNDDIIRTMFNMLLESTIPPFRLDSSTFIINPRKTIETIKGDIDNLPKSSQGYQAAELRLNAIYEAVFKKQRTIASITAETGVCFTCKYFKERKDL